MHLLVVEHDERIASGIDADLPLHGRMMDLSADAEQAADFDGRILDLVRPHEHGMASCTAPCSPSHLEPLPPFSHHAPT